MRKDYTLEFLRGKIAQTGTALCNFHLPGFSDISFIIHTNSVDENGNICFNLIDSLPATSKKDLQLFGMKLFFYKKGLGYHLNIEAAGTATYTSAEGSSKENRNMLNVRAKILTAEYAEGRDKVLHPNFFTSLRKKFTQAAASIFWI